MAIMPDNFEYSVAIVCALPLEMAATTAMLDETHRMPRWQDPRDKNNYTLGRMGQHYIVIACLPDGVYGMTAATSLITWMISSYRNIKFALIVGIGGGVPSTSHDIRLGDVVVSKPRGTSPGIIQYDFGKAVNGNIIPNASLDMPPKVLLTAMSSLAADHMMSGNKISSHISKMLQDYPLMQERFSYPGAEKDLLYEANYNHDADIPTCDQCDSAKLIPRPIRKKKEPKIFYGTIGSGNLVIKDGATRDRLAKQNNDILCFEMEAAGLMGQLPCLVIRGICDYADAHKNKIWQEYAAATAAAYAKELLYAVPKRDISIEITSPTLTLQTSFKSQSTVQISTTEVQAPPSPSFILTDRFHLKGSISLAALVLDRRYPNQDTFVSSKVSLQPGGDFSVSVDQNFNELVGTCAKSSPAFKKALAKFFFPSSTKGIEGDIQVVSTQSSVYTLLQPRTLFNKISGTIEFQNWLGDAWAGKKPLYFVVGYRTVTDAQFIGKEIKSLSNRRIPQNISYKPRYNTDGERVYAICFRKVKFERSPKGTVQVLGSTNRWRVFNKQRGHALDSELEHIISADLCDDEEVGTNEFGVLPPLL
ncbi:hypothetical protein TWF569_007820 [Orbilia oligospora]|uniref:Nucleoside phosphorylase domain-containing protein n=1 Tax=Orbilia oligospora TaxID=2813651 RepID=A0A7C8J5X6_ORBOL|nr:hypothetical protein TWF102_006566 [Orbilia oligospora]KAF3098244.1 hypothetical protein TWF103_009071 [Orbilia oligospora]KAF3116504.1 hypothetical protein TWF706_004139 [Orbilia oligospora]KAF3141597.1 hypothetical protein TWF569_007820 [Orbilia oligospora]